MLAPIALTPAILADSRPTRGRWSTTDRIRILYRMTERRRYPNTSAELPYHASQPEPAPVEGCAGCRELAIIRERARVVDDLATITSVNALMRRQPEGHG
ncbi:hypothetical protein GCM10009549_18230 [Streptomyces thermoalcalitolerans]|uniref:Uncharacterized protein n=1 Tax=Streptomyces thermoalcalitolerans TaxID=65605 RepID=A0ABN1NJA3_9ACTN